MFCVYFRMTRIWSTSLLTMMAWTVSLKWDQRPTRTTRITYSEVDTLYSILHSIQSNVYNIIYINNSPSLLLCTQRYVHLQASPLNNAGILIRITIYIWLPHTLFHSPLCMLVCIEPPLTSIVNKYIFTYPEVCRPFLPLQSNTWQSTFHKVQII